MTPERSTPGDQRVPRTRTRTIVVVGVALIVAFLILLAVGVVPRITNDRALAASAERAREAVPGVNVFRPEPSIESALVLAGTTQAIQDAIIYARTSGYMGKRYVDISDHVAAGQLLARIDSPEVDDQLKQASADLQQSEKTLDLQNAVLDLAQKTMARYKAADAEKAVALEALDQAISAYNSALASVAAAEATVQSYRANVQRLETLTEFERVVAPFSGTVIQRNVDEGALITAGSPTDNIAVAPTSVSGAANGLFEVAQIDTLRVFVNVPQAYAPNVQAGMPASVSVRGYLATPVSAAVARTSSALDPGSRTLLTEVDIPNRQHVLLPGMFVYVNFEIRPSGTRWRVPSTAIVFDPQGHGTRVVTIGAGYTLHFQPVTLGRDFGTYIDVQDGLRGDETIVTQPRVDLREGQKVRPIVSKDHE